MKALTDKHRLLISTGTKARAVLVLGLLLLLTLPVLAQSGGSLDLTWNTVDGGGGRSAGGAFALQGTIGQADAGSLSGGAYTLSGGFHLKAPDLSSLFLPLVLH